MITGTRHLRRCRFPSNSSARQRVINHIYPSRACRPVTVPCLCLERGEGGHRGFSLNSKPVINLGCVGVLRMTRLWVRNNIGDGGQVSQGCPVRPTLIHARCLGVGLRLGFLQSLSSLYPSPFTKDTTLSRRHVRTWKLLLTNERLCSRRSKSNFIITLAWDLFTHESSP